MELLGSYFYVLFFHLFWLSFIWDLLRTAMIKQACSVFFDCLKNGIVNKKIEMIAKSNRALIFWWIWKWFGPWRRTGWIDFGKLVKSCYHMLFSIALFRSFFLKNYMHFACCANQLLLLLLSHLFVLLQ